MKIIVSTAARLWAGRLWNQFLVGQGTVSLLHCVQKDKWVYLASYLMHISGKVVWSWPHKLLLVSRLINAYSYTSVFIRLDVTMLKYRDNLTFHKYILLFTCFVLVTAVWINFCKVADSGGHRSLLPYEPCHDHLASIPEMEENGHTVWGDFKYKIK
jgi:hypothetical protein